MLLHWLLAIGFLLFFILHGLYFPGEVFAIVAVCSVGTLGLVMTYFQHYFVIIFKGQDPTICVNHIQASHNQNFFNYEQDCKHIPLSLPDDDKRVSFNKKHYPRGVAYKQTI